MWPPIIKIFSVWFYVGNVKNEKEEERNNKKERENGAKKIHRNWFVGGANIDETGRIGLRKCLELKE